MNTIFTEIADVDNLILSYFGIVELLNLISVSKIAHKKIIQIANYNDPKELYEMMHNTDRRRVMFWQHLTHIGSEDNLITKYYLAACALCETVTIKHLSEKYDFKDTKIYGFYEILKTNKLSTIKWFYNNYGDCKFITEITTNNVILGMLYPETIDYLCSIAPNFLNVIHTPECLEQVINYNNLKLLEWIHDKVNYDPIKIWGELYDRQIESVKWLITKYDNNTLRKIRESLLTRSWPSMNLLIMAILDEKLSTKSHDFELLTECSKIVYEAAPWDHFFDLAEKYPVTWDTIIKIYYLVMPSQSKLVQFLFLKNQIPVSDLLPLFKNCYNPDLIDFWIVNYKIYNYIDETDDETMKLLLRNYTLFKKYFMDHRVLETKGMNPMEIFTGKVFNYAYQNDIAKLEIVKYILICNPDAMDDFDMTTLYGINFDIVLFFFEIGLINFKEIVKYVYPYLNKIKNSYYPDNLYGIVELAMNKRFDLSAIVDVQNVFELLSRKSLPMALNFYEHYKSNINLNTNMKVWLNGNRI